jgi:hypothetical protein
VGRIVVSSISGTSGGSNGRPGRSAGALVASGAREATEVACSTYGGLPGRGLTDNGAPCGTAVLSEGETTSACGSSDIGAEGSGDMVITISTRPASASGMAAMRPVCDGEDILLTVEDSVPNPLTLMEFRISPNSASSWASSGPLPPSPRDVCRASADLLTLGIEMLILRLSDNPIGSVGLVATFKLLPLLLRLP